ncbi:ABC transporter ATP-binding protein [Faecalicatena contorta]|uniref:Carbohydrate ABC transporter ATP-binding protein, CUT1 family n=1 Tax=Faecalicatena contorta TaxID=39482 RepID=A0A315ZXR3_9FIRM|nr:ABC transporter ATP-binding protein [Faecalicatena contorta]PWJ50446.1 carbohydrate ABC transporter ATP-binding protein (CUT1 family) [Faecalicatena contorta]SUQ13854.1 carbohydrate ABC transporter ATP-binding protein, CUT1 family [Faecalicatena contorta]
MSRIELENVTKKFGKVTALDGISLDIKDKEFFVLFGPAGAGKTTILNCIAGIQIPEEGTIKFDGEVVNLVDAAHRNTAMVFENYALYPQMTVYDNMASPLRSNLYKKDEKYIKNKIQEVAEMMKMEHLLERLPSQLSNGQKQRVAMGRALVRSPRVYLMDEPLAHLDAKLRNSMRTELKEIQANFGTTSVYVTHDFMEAMSLGDRIAIVNEGKIVQIGTSDEIYYMPCNEFVSQLMGDPEINIISGTLKKEEDSWQFAMDAGGKVYTLPEEDELFARLEQMGCENVDIGMRPQNLKYSFEPKEGYLKCTVYSYESIGNKAVIVADMKGLQLRMIAPNGLTVKIDQNVYVDMELNHAMFFNAETKEYLTRYNEAAVKALAEQEG